MEQTYPFKLDPLLYDYDALEPYIDTKTIRIHHERHQQNYVNALNDTLKDYPQYHRLTLSQLIVRSHQLPRKISTAVKNNAGGVWNHHLYFRCLTPTSNLSDATKLTDAIENCYGSFEHFQETFTERKLQVQVEHFRVKV